MKMPTEKNYIDNLYSLENMVEYALKCSTIGEDIINRMDSIDSIILPSRGAIPIFFEALSYIESISHKNKNAEKFLESLALCPFVYDYYKRISNKEFPKTADGKINVLILPYTADLNLKDTKADSNKFMDMMREYWVNMTSLFYKPKEERTKDKSFLLYLSLLSEIEGRNDLANYYKKFPKIKKPLLIDTVISGRAISTILDNFEKVMNEGKIDSMPEAMIVIDKNGNKLKSPYKEKILIHKARGLDRKPISEYKVPELFTEDKGSALEGLISVVYPNVMVYSKRLEYFGEGNFIGAGTWMMPEEEYQKIFLRFLKSLNYSIKYLEGGKEEHNKLMKELDVLKNDLKRVFRKNNADELIYSMSLLNKAQEKRDEDEEYGFSGGYETRAHVVHVNLKKGSLERFLESKP